MKLKVFWIGKTKEPAITSLSDEYLKRLSRYADVEGVALKDEAAVLKLCRREQRAAAHATLVLLDGRGKPLSSEELAKFIDNHQNTNPNALCFAVGPSNGFSGVTLKAADLLFSLGKLTLPHELARVVLLEQLYRAYTILNRHPYHVGH